MKGGRRIRIPGLVDITRVGDPHALGEFAEDARMDRRFEPAGPLINRILAGRLRRFLKHQGKPLPPVAARDEPGRGGRQVALEAALAGQIGAFDPGLITELATLVSGNAGRAEIGRLAQEAIGRSFLPGFRASPQTWAAAVLLDQAPRSMNPLKQLMWRLSGEVTRARGVLAAAVEGDGAALHAISLAVHNLVKSLERMQMLLRAGDASRRDAEEVVTLCLAAPDRVLRQVCGAAGGSGTDALPPGALVVLELEACRARTLRRDVAFMSGTWSMCPAHLWVPALLAAVWRKAAERQEPRR